VLGYGGAEVPREVRGCLPWPVMKATLVIQVQLPAQTAAQVARLIKLLEADTKARERKAVAP